MHSNEAGPRVLSFPTDERARRERLLRIAATALPVLHAAVAMRNATMVQAVVDALCALPNHEEASRHLASIGI